jgi:decaprenylphospho-beta-D-erythro-pentofuranosid-2-ulose 2-reductase
VIDALGNPQSALLLGGTSEIGLAVVRRLVRGGRMTHVVLAGRDQDRLAAAAAALRQAGVATVETAAFDAAETAAHAKTLGEVFDRMGDVDVVVLAFGVLGDQEGFEADPDAAVDAAVVNYVGAVSAGLRVAERLRRQGHGRLVVLSSVAGERARRSNFVYGSTKAGLDAFATGLGDALHGSGASVLVVRPGFVRTRMTEGMAPAPLATTPEAVADVVAEALARGKEQVWAPPPLRWVMAVLRHLPRAVFRRLPL